MVATMVGLYCRKKEGNKNLCPDCVALLEYANKRLDACKFGENKTSCRKCPVHCYRPDMRQQMREVMRWVGPRMMLYRPLDAIAHLFNETFRSNSNMNRIL